MIIERITKEIKSIKIRTGFISLCVIYVSMLLPGIILQTPAQASFLPLIITLLLSATYIRKAKENINGKTKLFSKENKIKIFLESSFTKKNSNLFFMSYMFVIAICAFIIKLPALMIIFFIVTLLFVGIIISSLDEDTNPEKPQGFEKFTNNAGHEWSKFNSIETYNTGNWQYNDPMSPGNTIYPHR